jgi:hypothetical protein
MKGKENPIRPVHEVSIFEATSGRHEDGRIFLAKEHGCVKVDRRKEIALKWAQEGLSGPRNR